MVGNVLQIAKIDPEKNYLYFCIYKVRAFFGHIIIILTQDASSIESAATIFFQATFPVGNSAAPYSPFKYFTPSAEICQDAWWAQIISDILFQVIRHLINNSPK
jgi:hypothetical protein